MSNRDPDLTAEEAAIIADYEEDAFQSVMTEELREAQTKAAKQAFKKDKRVNIRLSHQDLERLQAHALRDGIPYQTLMSSVIHKYVNGRFHERDS